MVLIDTDMIVTRPLDELIERGGGGQGGRVRERHRRHVPRVGRGARARPASRRQPYVELRASSRIGGELGAPRSCALLAERQSAIDFERTYWRERRITDYPLLYADQDVLNAILAARVGAERLRRARPAPRAAARRSRACEVADARQRCAAPTRDGIEPSSSTTGSPSRGSSRPTTASTRGCCGACWSATTSRSGSPSDEIPLRFRGGLRACAERTRINARERLRYHVREPLARAGQGGR